MKRLIFPVLALLIAVLLAQPNYETMLNRPDITGLTGGGATNLDGIPTTELAVGTILIIYDGSESRIYRLTAGTDAENPPAVIRPDDFNATTNAKVWKVNISSDPAETGHGGSGGADGDWQYVVTNVADTSLETTGKWGISRGGNIRYGNADSTHINLGVACTTGTSGQNYKYCTAAGGMGNAASGNASTVGGGESNGASGSHSTVAGGYTNKASGLRSTVGGGYNNSASGGLAIVGGGDSNDASGNWATIAGGRVNTAQGESSAIPGGRANQVFKDYSFAFGWGADVPLTAGYSAVFNWESANGTVFIETDALSTAYVLYINGSAFASGGTWDTSDSTFKEDIHPIDNALKIVDAMEPVAYKWIDDQKIADKNCNRFIHH